MGRDLVDRATGSGRPALICDDTFWDLGAVILERKESLFGRVSYEGKLCVVVEEGPGDVLVKDSIRKLAERVFFEQVDIQPGHGPNLSPTHADMNLIQEMLYVI
jgi:hypothetical protein